MIGSQWGFEKHDQLNPIEIEIEDYRVINLLRRNKNATYTFISIGLLFSSELKKNTNQIFIASNGLNNAKDSLINGNML